MGDSIHYCEACHNNVGCHLYRECLNERKPPTTRIMLYGENITINEESKTVILKYPNGLRRIELRDRLEMFYKVMSVYHGNQNHTAAVFERSAELHRCVMIDVGAEEAENNTRNLQHHFETTVGLWATDRPELFADHPHYGLLFEIKATENQTTE